MDRTLQFGIDLLATEHADWLKHSRVGLVAHAASRTTGGMPSADLLKHILGNRLVCLFGPEHGFRGQAGAGEQVAHAQHPEWGIPVHSLYGRTRRPTSEMLHGVDVIVFDLQDLGARPYTYVSTLRYVLEAAAEHDRAVIVADRPVPLAGVVDGPMLQNDFESFVGGIPSPVVYGMTPGETALWLQATLGLDLELRIARVRGYGRETTPAPAWPEWVPSSPAIRSWSIGQSFPITVFLEALPGVDHARGTDAPFQRVGAPWLDAAKMASVLNGMSLPGMQFKPTDYEAQTGSHRGLHLHGVTIEIIDPGIFAPVRTGVAIIEALQQLHGAAWLWSQPGTRPEFFDQLMGTDAVRLALHDGLTANDIAAGWDKDLQLFRQQREPHLLYP